MIKNCNELLNKFPLLYGDKDKSPQETLVCFGIECGPGWYDLLYDLSEKLENLIEQFRKDYPTCTSYPRAMQIKEKFGTLRFYMTSATDEMWKAIEVAEVKSQYICEECGASGETMNHCNWLKTVCDDCAEKLGYTKIEEEDDIEDEIE